VPITVERLGGYFFVVCTARSCSREGVGTGNKARRLFSKVIDSHVTRWIYMFGIGMPELLVILVIILIIFGAGKLPEIGGAIGKGIRNFKTSFTEQDNLSDKKGDSEKIEDKDK